MPSSVQIVTYCRGADRTWCDPGFMTDFLVEQCHGYVGVSFAQPF